MKLKVVFVIWKDACSLTNGWKSADEIDTKMRFHCQSAGFLVKEDEHGIVLAVDRDPETGEWRGLGFIPKAMIRRKKVFTVEDK